MSTRLQGDIRDLQKTLRAVIKQTKIAEADIVNEALLDIAEEAQRRTPFTSPDQIEQELRTDNLVFKLAVSNLRNSGQPINKDSISTEAFRIITERRASSGARAAGWNPSIRALGGVPGIVERPGGIGANTQTKKATVDDLSGEIENVRYGFQKGANAENSRGQMEDALESAVEHVTHNITKEAELRIERILNKNSD